MFEHWIKPPIFEETKQFFEVCPVPIYVVSNIDSDDILQAIKYHKLKPAGYLQVKIRSHINQEKSCLNLH